MSLSLEPGKGLRLKLGSLSPIRTWHGGSNFWCHEFQLTIRSGALASFLPRATENEDSVLFEHRSGGTEQAGTSTAISNISEIPAGELEALRAAVNELKKKAEDPHCDRTKRQMIEGFRLPDPQKDRDLYRLIGKGASAKLIVLWGVEREEGSALAPGAAVDLMHTAGGEGVAPAPKRSKLVPVLLLLALLGGGGWYYWQEKERARIAAEMATLAAQRAKEAEEAKRKAAEAQERERLAAAAATAAAAKNKAPAASSAPTISVTPMSPAAVDAPKPTTVMPSSTTSSESKKSTDSKSTTSTDLTKKATATEPAKTTTTTTTTSSTTSATKTLSAAPGTIVRNSSGSVTGVVGNDGKVAHAKAGTSVGKDGKVTSSAPGTVVRGSSGACMGVCGADGKVVPATLGRIVEDSTGTLKSGPPGTVIRDSKGSITGVCDSQGKVVPAAPGTMLDKEGKIVSSSPGTVLRDSFGSVTGVADAEGRIVNAANGAVLEDDSVTGLATDSTAPGSVTTPMTSSQGPLPAGISSLSVVSTSLSDVLGNGNVEVLLNVVARDTAGTVVNAPEINGWKINGELQNEPDGTPAHGPVVPVSLPPGTYRISTVGRGADGQPFQTEADVQVSAKH